MSLFQRFVLIIVSLFLVSASLPYVIYRDMYWHINPAKMYFYVIAGMIVAVYNLVIVFKMANKKYFLVEDDELREKITELHTKRRDES